MDRQDDKVYEGKIEEREGGNSVPFNPLRQSEAVEHGHQLELVQNRRRHARQIKTLLQSRERLRDESEGGDGKQKNGAYVGATVDGYGLVDARGGRLPLATDGSRASKEQLSSQHGNYLPHLVMRDNTYAARSNQVNMEHQASSRRRAGAGRLAGRGTFAAGGLGSPFTLSDDDLADVDYDYLEDLGMMRTRNIKAGRNTNTKSKKSVAASRESMQTLKQNANNTILQTSANLLLEHSYISAIDTHENGTAYDNDAPDSARKSRIDYNMLLKSKPGSLIPNKAIYDAAVREIDQPKMMLSNYDYMKRMSFHKQGFLQIDSMCKWKKKDFKGMKKKFYISEVKKVNDQILQIAEKSDLEKIEVYHDRYPSLGLRRAVKRFLIRCHIVSAAIINSPAFDQVSVSVIVVNSIVMSLEDPYQEPSPTLAIIDYIFTGLYTVEMLLKIMGLGFVYDKGSYLRDGWNVLDFIIVITSYFPLLTSSESGSQADAEVGPQAGQGQSFDFSSLRTFRVLRPLKTISSIQGLKVIMQALFAAAPLLVDTLMILTFFFFISSIAGSQLFTGILKNRCVAIQTGREHPDDLLCGSGQGCPGGYFCGKTNQNPNNGVSNFDVIFYALLMVFQSVTLEGWSDLMMLLEQVFVPVVIYIFMIPLVFIGAFFLLNLTLAVINSSFNETHKKHQQVRDFEQDDTAGDVETQMEKKLQNMNQMSVSQYITARVYAKRMVQFLRMRQRIKQIEQERTEMLRLRRANNRLGVQAVEGAARLPLKLPLNGVDNASRQNQADSAGRLEIDVPNLLTHSISKSIQSKNTEDDATEGVLLDRTTTRMFNQNGGSGEIVLSGRDLELKKMQSYKSIIEEEEGEHQDDKSDQEKEQHLKNVQSLVKNGKAKMLLNGHSTQDIATPKILKGSQKKGKLDHRHRTHQSGSASGAPGLQMMGNIGLTKYGVVLGGKKEKNQLSDQFAVDLQIENVIGNAENDGEQMNHRYNTNSSFPIENYDSRWQHQLSNGQKKNPEVEDIAKQLEDVDCSRRLPRPASPVLPALSDRDNDDDSGLFTSDSDFDEAAREARNHTATENRDCGSQHELDPEEQRANVSRTFKRMLSQNYKRGINLNPHLQSQMNQNPTEQVLESTHSAASKILDFDNRSLNTEIENKYWRRSKQNWKQKKDPYQDDTISMISSHLQEQYLTQNKGNIYKEARGTKDMRTLREFIDTTRPEDPFYEVNPLTHKVVINPESQYHGTSQQEIFLLRYTKQEVQGKMENNKFLKLSKQFLEEFPDDDRMVTFTRPRFKPYQQKVEYQVLSESSELDEESPISPDDDDRCAEEQPYITPGYIRYRKDVEHIHINEIAKRSDIVISSTLSFNMIPKDTRIISEIHQVNMKKDDIADYIDARNAFKAMIKEYQYQNGNIRDKDKHFKDVYLRSFIHRSAFNAKTLINFKQKVKELNRNRVEQKAKDPVEEKQERIKHEQNKKAVEKMIANGYPEYNSITIKKLLSGKAYEPFEEGDQAQVVEPLRPLIKQKHEEDDGQSRLEKTLIQWTDFSKMDLRKHHDHECHLDQDEIPETLRKEFHMPHEMMYFEVDFNQIKKHDAGIKRLRPIWSGQDVIPIKLDHEKSLSIVEKINNIRVWPASPMSNCYKKFRFVLRRIVKSGQFESLMTLMVLLNSVTLALERHGITQEERDLLDTFDQWFTNIFIVEMASKIIAIGIQKYLMDRMNWLDGSVVMLSVFEIIYKAAQSGTMNLQGFKTLRLFRTLRVFRVMRVLRALKSMQMIVSVMAKSYMSFIYITMLMFLFIYIFALLGMSIFGATMNFPDGRPRSNYDGMLISSVTTFQVLTMENWQVILFNLMRSDQNNKFFVSFILMGWIFLGNFILLNLFLAILLDAFLEEEDETMGGGEELEKIKHRKQTKAAMKQKKREQDKLTIRIVGQKKKEKSAMAKMLMGDENYESEDLEDLDEEQIIQIFKQQGIIKQSKDEQKEIKLYVGPPPIECQTSLYMFSKENRFRQLAYRLIKHPAWDNTIIVLIILSSVKLASDTYLSGLGEDDIIKKVSNIADDIFNYAFIVELTLKVIAMGLFMDGGSYLRESWNQLDFFIVISSIIDMTLQALADGQSIGFVKILRLLRVLRPLRMISRNPDLKLMVSALMESVGHILNVLVVIGIIYMIFSILGVNLFAGKFFYCSEDPLKLSTRIECEEAGGEWLSRDHNFDDVVYGFNTLMIVASLEGWPDIMFYAADSVDVDQGPEIDHSLPLASAFFLVYIMLGSFFLLNLFIGVLFVKFNQAKSENEKGLKPQDLAWMDIQRLILSQSPEYETTNVPDSPQRKKAHDLVTTRSFELAIMTCIVFNMLQMAMEYEGSSARYKRGLKYSNYFFSAVFIVEASLKLTAFGSSYFENGWNKFDFFVVTASILDISMDILGASSLQGIAFMPSLARVFRVLRVTRLFKLAGSLKGLQAIIQTIIFSIAQLSNVVLLLFIILFMFTVLAVEMFGTISKGEVISEYKNFSNFHQSMLLLLAIMTGEDWNRVMFDCSRTPEQGCVAGQNCGSVLALFYFNFVIIVCSYVMLQLFILVIIQQFDKYYLTQDSSIKTFKDDLDKFYRVWKVFTQKRYRCFKIRENQLQPFFRELGGTEDDENSLGFHRDIESHELKKNILKMGIKSNNGFIFFNELLYRCMRKKFGSMKLSRQMQIFELRTQYSIFLITQEVQNKLEHRQSTVKQDTLYNDLIQKSGGFNPFLTEMNYKITFKTWLKFARNRMRMERQGRDSRRMSVRQNIRESLVKFIDVEIEIQQEIEYTSEEEVEVSSQMTSQMFRSQKLEKLSKAKSQVHSIKDSSEPARLCHKRQARSDHLIAFERQMLNKFKSLRSVRAPASNDRQSQVPRTPLKTDQLLDSEAGNLPASQAKSQQGRAYLANSALKKLRQDLLHKQSSTVPRKREGGIEESLRKQKSSNIRQADRKSPQQK